MAMRRRSVICQACRCHVRSGERVCPHCRADLASPSASRSPRRRAVEIRRVLFATAVAGLGTVSCGGRVYGNASATEQPAAGISPGASSTVEREVAGGCLLSDGTLAHCGPPYPASPDCSCGPAGECMNDLCVTRSCATDQYLDDAGNCSSVDWFGPVPSSTHSCYGCPPYLG
jgi:hypothetical protein